MGMVDDIKKNQLSTASFINEELNKMEHGIIFDLQCRCKDALPKGFFYKYYSVEANYYSLIDYSDAIRLDLYRKNRHVLFSEGKNKLYDRLCREGFEDIKISFYDYGGKYDGFKERELYRLTVIVKWT